MTPNTAHKNKRHAIPATIANLLYEIEEGWYAQAISLADPSSLRWGSMDLSCYVKTISLRNNELVVQCELPAKEENDPNDYPLKHLMNQGLEITCSDGTTITSRHAYVDSYGFDSHTDDAGARVLTDRVKIAASEWKLLRPKAKPILWVGSVSGDQLDGYGNLTLIAKSGSGAFSSGHFYLQGDKYVYYIMQVKSKT